jgi:hypothetical protein
MKAGETTVKDLLEGDKLFVIPAYQRRYAWTKTEWEPLWRAVSRQYRDQTGGGSLQGHFIGSVVYASRQAFGTDAPNFDLIDGQQRMTSILLLLRAIRDAAPADSAAQKRAEAFMGNQFETGDNAFKVYPGEHDRGNVHAVLRGDIERSGGLPLSAYRYFRERIDELGSEGAIDFSVLLRSATGRLEVVQILTGPGDNAHRIFQTLNSTGKELSAVDLLRNHFFMLLPTAVDAAYATFWKPMEERLGESFQTFLWVDLVTRVGLEGVPNRSDRIYAEWQVILDDYSGDEAAVMRVLGDLEARSAAYVQMTMAATGEPTIDRLLRHLRDWGAAVHAPLTFLILERWRAREADTTRVVAALDCIESFLVRRMLAGVPTNNLNRIFTTSVGQLAPSSEDIDVAVRRILSQPGKYWPSDEAIQREGLTIPFYERQRATQRQFILRRLEERISAPYRVDWQACHFTIEHVLPQGITDWWKQHLLESGEQEPVKAHEELRHTLGNLTLTCENPALGQMNLSGKAQFFMADPVKMNDSIAEQASWTRQQILERGGWLLGEAAQLWVAPIPAEELDDLAVATSVRVALESMPDGRWIPINVLMEHLEATQDQLQRALESLASLEAAERVLSPSGALRPDQDHAGRRGTALAHLLAQGVVSTDDVERADISLALSVEELVALAGD